MWCQLYNNVSSDFTTCQSLVPCCLLPKDHIKTTENAGYVKKIPLSPLWQRGTKGDFFAISVCSAMSFARRSRGPCLLGPNASYQLLAGTIRALIKVKGAVAHVVAGAVSDCSLKTTKNGSPFSSI